MINHALFMETEDYRLSYFPSSSAYQDMARPSAVLLRQVMRRAKENKQKIPDDAVMHHYC